MRLLHIMLRVQDLDSSILFYQTMFNMKVLRKKEYPSGRFTLVFMGFDDEQSETAIELTYNWDKHQYEKGNGFGHLAFGVKNIYETCDLIKKNGGKITRKPGPMKHGTTILAFVEDPNGYQIELLERS
tara:strand:+ start:182 stop:565 length:384 start_codon:yes stop_codon:yes gene_type:complete